MQKNKSGAKSNLDNGDAATHLFLNMLNSDTLHASRNLLYEHV